MQAMLQQAADQDGTVEIGETDEYEPTSELEFNIRDEELQMFEGADSGLYVKTPEMSTDTYAEVIPTPSGPSVELVVGLETELTELDPASRSVSDPEESSMLMD